MAGSKATPSWKRPKARKAWTRRWTSSFSYGTKSLDRLAFQKALDDIGAIESAGTDFSLQVLTEHFERGVQLLADNELSPALPEKDFKIIQPQLAAAVAGELQSPDYLAGRALRAALFPKTRSGPTGNHARHHQVPDHPGRAGLLPARLPARPDDHRRHRQGDAGQTPWRSLQNTLATGRPSARSPTPSSRRRRTTRPSTTHVPDASRVQDKVTLAETLTLTRTNADYYALELGNHVLGGGFYATRLYRDLREKNGLVYFVYFVVQRRPDPRGL